MNGRYTRIKKILINSYHFDCPVEIQKGAILYDRESNNIILQLKFSNISKKNITAIEINIQCYEGDLDKLILADQLFYTYTNIPIKPYQTAGEKVPVVLKSTVRDVVIDISMVVFANGEIWKPQDSSIYNQIELIPVSVLGNDILKFYKTEYIERFNSNKEILDFFPLQNEDLWVCSCGRANKNNITICKRCRSDKENVFEYINSEYIKKAFLEYTEAQVNLQKELKEIELVKERTVQLEKENIEKIINVKKDKRKKILRISLATIFALILFSAAFIFFTKPGKYIQANYYQGNSNFKKSIELYDSINGYKNSNELIEISLYNQALEMIQKKENNTAVQLLEKIVVEGNNKELFKVAHYKLGYEYFKINEYDKAIETIEITGLPITDYDAKYVLLQSYIEKVRDLIKDQKYEEAKKIVFDEIDKLSKHTYNAEVQNLKSELEKIND